MWITFNGNRVKIDEYSLSYEKLSELAGIAPDKSPTVVYSNPFVYDYNYVFSGDTLEIVDNLTVDVSLKGNKI